MAFDTIVMVDWSARSKPSPARPSADAIWAAVARDGVVADIAYRRTRGSAVEWLAGLISAERAEGRRVLAGFDFPFGYPAGTAEAVAGRPEGLTLWAWLAARIEDGPDNATNHYRIAEAINARFPGPGPFWGRPATWDHPGVPVRKAGIAYARPAEFRHVESRARGAKSVWQLAYSGSVGSQAILGIAALERLRRRVPGCVVWPLETGMRAPDAPVVLAEVYPSLLRDAVRAAQAPGEILDRAQVRVLAGRMAALDAAGRLAPLFGPPAGLSAAAAAAVEREEAWILGVGAAGAPPLA